MISGYDTCTHLEIKFQKNQGYKILSAMKLLAADNEPDIVAPINLDPIQVEPAIVRTEVEIRSVDIAVRIPPTRAFP